MNQLTKSMKEKEDTWISYFKREREENNERLLGSSGLFIGRGWQRNNTIILFIYFFAVQGHVSTPGPAT